jgi:hypothetical protein
MRRTKRRHLQFDPLEERALLSGVHIHAIPSGGGRGLAEIRRTNPSGTGTLIDKVAPDSRVYRPVQHSSLSTHRLGGNEGIGNGNLASHGDPVNVGKGGPGNGLLGNGSARISTGGGSGGYPNGEAFTGARIPMNGGSGGYLNRVAYNAGISKDSKAAGYLFGAAYGSARIPMNGGSGGYLNGTDYYSARIPMNGGSGGYLFGAAGAIRKAAT